MEPNTIMRHFGYAHLKEGAIQETSKKFAELAEWVENNISPSAEKSAGLRKILEAKDCVVRAKIEQITPGE